MRYNKRRCKRQAEEELELIFCSGSATDLSLIHISVPQHLTNFVHAPWVGDLELLIALGFFLMTAHACFYAGGNSGGAQPKNVISEACPLSGGNTDACKGQKQPVGKHHLEQLRLMDIVGVVALIILVGAHSRHGKAYLCLRVFLL